jgi:hypothetical protein
MSSQTSQTSQTPQIPQTDILTSQSMSSIKYTKLMDTPSHKELMKKVEQYYELKMKYEQEKEKARNKVRETSLSKTAREKKREYAQIIHKCINCNRKVGMIFESTNNTLIAKCGASSGVYKNKKGEPIEECDLNLSIVVPDYYNIDNLIHDYDKLLSKIKKDLKVLKLKHLYGYVSDEESITIYNNLISEYQSYTEIYSALKLKKIEKTNNDTEYIARLENEHTTLYNLIIDGMNEAVNNKENTKELKNKVFELYGRMLSINRELRKKKEFKTFFVAENDKDLIRSSTFMMRNTMEENEIVI